MKSYIIEYSSKTIWDECYNWTAYRETEEGARKFIEELKKNKNIYRICLTIREEVL